MKHLYLYFLFFCATSLTAQSDCIPDAYPQYPGGKLALQSFFKENVSIPSHCAEWVFSIILQIEIDSTGYPLSLEVLKPREICFEPITTQFWNGMPCWTPGSINGKPATMTTRCLVRIGLE